MSNIAFVMPVFLATGSTIIIVVLLIIKGIIQKEQIKNINTEKMDSLIGEIKQENADIKKDLQVIKEKVEAIDKMMRDI